ncbi:MAG: AMP-binding protein [Planctomycetaceae bacterium]|jgi:acyl-CoA synthetase (AMP-forming)/AMP-acid ligase II|nr:AMP-binding protein [Planctomycetaceae bacterium]
MNLFDGIERFGERVAVIGDSGSISYCGLLELSASISDLVKPRSFVFLLGQNNPVCVAAYVGFLRRRVVPLLLSDVISGEQLTRLINIYHPTHIFVPSVRLNEFLYEYEVVGEFGNYTQAALKFMELNTQPQQREAVVQGRSLPPIPASVYVLLRRVGVVDGEVRLHDDLGLVLTTSGSTGSPRLVRLSYKNILSNTESIIRYLNITPEDRAITTMPMTYSYGLSIINTHLYCGGSVILTELTLMERGFWNMFKEWQPSTFGGVPYIFEMLKRLRFSRMELPLLRYVTQAGGKLSSELVSEFRDICADKGVEFIVMYGQTEAAARMSYLPFEQSFDKAGSIGIAIPDGEFWLEDDAGNVINESNVAGELVYRGANVSMGYAEEVDDLAKADENGGVLRTGDIAQRDIDGYYYIVGRKKRFLKIFGNRVNLDEVDQLLKRNGYEAVSAGQDDRIRIFVTQNQVDQIKSLLVEQLRLHPTAFDVQFIPQIPRNNSGKVIYSMLPE